MNLKKEAGYYVLSNFNLLSPKKMTDILMAFSEKKMNLLFGCKWKSINFSQLEKDVLDEELRKILNQLSPFLLEDEEAERQNNEDKNFINERRVYINDKWELPWEPPNYDVKDTIWYRPKNKIEIMKAIRLNQEFHCVVLEEGKDFDCYSYSLGCLEDDEGSILVIIEKNNGNFILDVLPKLQRIVNISID